MFEQRTFGAWRMDVRTFFVGCLFALACIVPVLPLKAETVVQGVLHLVLMATFLFKTFMP